MRGLAVLMALWPALVGAQEYVRSSGPLTDHDFYRAVACGADPGGECRGPFVRWNRSTVTVTLDPAPPSYPVGLARVLSEALDTAIAQINGSAPGLTLRRIGKGQDADIEMRLLSISEGDMIRGSGRQEMDGVPIGAAMVQVWWDQRLSLTDAVIVFAADIPEHEAGPILLEELTQSLGLMTDIRNPFYETRSVFSEDSNSVEKLGAQDRMVLRRHYP